MFLPLVALLATSYGWRQASLAVALAAVGVVPLVLAFLRDRPRDVGATAYGAEAEAEPESDEPATGGSAARAVRVLTDVVRHRTFLLLAGGFAICGASTNGLIGTHFVPAAHDHGMPYTTAASLLALVGIFDIIGTVASGWLTDRVDPRLLLAVYYTLRGGALVLLPQLFAPTTEPPMWAFVIFYGLDWVATVPPTVALCRQWFGRAKGPIVFGWVFASHQLGAAVAAFAAGAARDQLGSYDVAWYAAGGLCVLATVMSLRIRRAPEPEPALRPAAETHDEPPG